MTESKLVWLAIGIFVGFMLWGERSPHMRPQQADESGNNQPTNGFLPGCATC